MNDQTYDQTFNRGDVIAFGPDGARRVGIVIGAYDDPALGEVLCVRTPQNALKEQKFDPCPIRLMNPRHASVSDLDDAAEAARAEAIERLTRYLSELRETA